MPNTPDLPLAHVVFRFMTTRIEDSFPREQVGAVTGAAYEHQYAEAALACLELLEKGQNACVFCEWHDDYVVVRDGSSPRYEFFQVKTRSMSQGAWTMTGLLGVKGARPRPQKTTKSKRSRRAKPKPLASSKKLSIVERLLDHQRRFPGACAVFAVVTNNEAKEDLFTDLLASAAELTLRGAGSNDLPKPLRDLLNELVAAYQSRDSAVTPEDVWTLVSRLRILAAKGRMGDQTVAIGLMGQRILELSEVDLKVSEQKQVAQQLLDTVRVKSHRVLKAEELDTPEKVRDAKAVSHDDLLRLLALSPSGYRALLRGGLDDIRQLSRLHRLCEKNRWGSQEIDLVCRIRVSWEVWRAKHLDAVSDSVFMMLTERAREMLRQLQQPDAHRPFTTLLHEAQSFSLEICKRPDLPDVTADELTGLVLALAASEE